MFRAKISLLAAVATGLAAAASGQILDGPEDFAQIARRGFAEVVNGTYTPAANGFPGLSLNLLGSPQNSYPWGMAFWAPPTPPGQSPYLWVGTVRNLLCFLAPGSSAAGSCPAPTEGGIPLPRFPQDAAEIWRYTPNGLGGITGTWNRVFQSAPVPLATRCAIAAAASGLTAVEDILTYAGDCILSGGSGYPNFPQHIGFRSLLACDADDDAPVSRLYVSNLGLPARVLVWDSASGGFIEASHTGDTFVAEELEDITLNMTPAQIQMIVEAVAAELPPTTPG
jgi:hypothetical protein